MAVTIPFRLNENAREFQAGEYTGFGIRTGVKYQDPKTKQDAYTNYEAPIFSKSASQIDFYRANLIKGALVVVSCEKQYVEIYNGQNGPVPTIKLLNANIEAITTGRAPDAAQQAYNQAQRPAQDYRGHTGSNQPNPTSAPAGFDSFDDDKLNVA